MWFKDYSGFPLTLKPSHLFGGLEMMSASEVLAAIVEQACAYIPESSVDVSKLEKSAGAYRDKKVSKEAFSKDKSPKEALTRVEKVPVASVASDFVRFNRLISLFKAVSLPTCLVNLFCRCLMKI